MSQFGEPWSRASGNGAWLRDKNFNLVCKVGCGVGQATEAELAERIITCINLLSDLSNDDIALLASSRDTHWREAIDGCLRRMRKEATE